MRDPYQQRVGGRWRFRRPNVLPERVWVTEEFDGFAKIEVGGVLLFWQRAGSEGDARFMPGDFAGAYPPGGWFGLLPTAVDDESERF